MKLLDKIPFQTVIVMTIFLGLAPFVPEPHLWQKLKMLFSGTLAAPLDMFDMLFHIAPALVLLAKIYRRNAGLDESES